MREEAGRNGALRCPGQSLAINCGFGLNHTPRSPHRRCHPVDKARCQFRPSNGINASVSNPTAPLSEAFTARFGGIERLYGRAGLARLARSHVCVVGLGGVGSWAVEALARSGVGRLTLVDLDDVCVSNINRQLHALDGTIGRSKAGVMAERVRAIHPACVVNPLPEFFSPDNAASILSTPFDGVIDAIDNVPNKCLLLAGCRERNLPVIASGAAGGRRDPTRIRVEDLMKTTHDRLLARTRETLRKSYGFQPASSGWEIPCVFSTEPPVVPRPEGFVRDIRAGAEDAPETVTRPRCDEGFGSAAFVTGAFGFAAAAALVRRLTG